MTKSDKLPTIGQAAESYGLTKEAFQKRISRAVKSDKFSEIRQELQISPDTPTGMKAPFTPELKALLAQSAWESPTESDAKTDTKPDTVNPTQSRQLKKPDTKPDAIPVQSPTTKPDNDRQPEPDTKPDTTISDRFFQSEIIVLSALLILIFSDGFSMSLLAGRTFGGSGLAYVLFSVVGLIIGYSAISTTRAAYHAPRRAWEKSWAPFWIILFAVFQTALHGSAFDLFGDWSDLVGRVLIVLSIPLATASLTTTILKR